MAVRFKKKKKVVLPLLTISIFIILLVLIGSYIAQKIAKYQYGNTVSEYDLPQITSPTKTSIEITYFGEVPKSVKIQRENPKDGSTYEMMPDATYDEENKKIYLSYDVKDIDWRYTLQIKPADNKEVQVYIEQAKSEKYINAAMSSEEVNGDTLITIVNFDPEITIYARGCVDNTGRSFSKPIDDVVIEPNSTVTIKLSDYSKLYEEANQLQLNISDDNENTENLHQSFRWN